MQSDQANASTHGPAPRLIGLTGGLASGKSTVGKMLRELGAAVVDADEVAKAVVEPGKPAYWEIVAAFGPEILLPSADPQNPAPIDRTRLAERVFSDEEARRKLNGITHPEIAAESARRIQEYFAKGHQVVVYEVTLLVENGLDRGLAGVIVVDVPEELQLQRAIERGLSEGQARLRIRAQAQRTQRLRAATWVIDNSKDMEATREAVASLWRQILATPASAAG